MIHLFTSTLNDITTCLKFCICLKNIWILSLLKLTHGSPAYVVGLAGGLQGQTVGLVLVLIGACWHDGLASAL